MPILTYKNWTTEEDSLLRKVIDGKSNFTDLCKLHFPDRTASSLQSRASKLGISNPFKSRDYYQNDDFWAVPNRLNSYWAGIITADGCITKDSRTGNPQTFKWECSVNDEAMMKQFVKDSGFTGKLRYMQRTMPSGYISKTCAIYINSKKWNIDLANNFNITPNKAARIKPPETINDELSLYLLKGYIDGDGCVNFCGDRVLKDNGTIKWKGSFVIRFATSGKDMLIWIKRLVEKYIFPERHTILNIIKGENYDSLAINGQRGIQLFLILSQLDCHCLERKWKQPKVLEYIKDKIAENPAAYSSFMKPLSFPAALPIEEKELNWASQYV